MDVDVGELEAEAMEAEDTIAHVLAACKSNDASMGISVPTGHIADGMYNDLCTCYDISLYCLYAPVNLVSGPHMAADHSYVQRVEEDVPLRESVDSGQSFVTDHAPAALCAIAHDLALGLSPSLYAAGSARYVTTLVLSLTSVTNSDAASFASSSMLLQINPITVEVPLHLLRVRLCVGKDAQVSVAADSTIAQIEQLLHNADHIPQTTNCILVFYLGHLLAPSAAPLRDLHLPKTAVIQVFYSLAWFHY
ncbi:hypothetical protein H4S07_000284 [Coemansia furcata]|uniref:Uncharacterized protein n=1 Tax=Coemansia furcata TaxID=417177 RepID=A0ACC1LRI6_9FUNG|nr:hypothetical protein H4S07_000284 [Coemansia furcata]